MTAEVILLSAKSLAMAADSAATITSSKIYNSAPKLFHLAEKHDVGLMLYNNADFMRIPWETLLHGFREQIQSQPQLDHLNDYAKALKAYLKANIGNFISQDNQRDFVLDTISSYIADLFDSADEELKALVLSEGRKVTKSEIRNVLKIIIDLEFDAFADSSDYEPDEGQQGLFSLVMNEYQSAINGIIDDLIEKRPLSSAYRKKLITVCCLSFSKHRELPFFTGVVLAGYGKQDFFPGCLTFHTDCLVSGVLRWMKQDNKSASIDPYGNYGQIIPFAQDDMIQEFVKGIHPRVLEAVLEAVSAAFGDVPSDKLKELFAKIVKIALDTSIDVLQAVSVLPNDELAAMAEALVTLTSFKRRVSMEAETVGGPVDVAVISKIDGFIWIKHKAYYDPKLNPHLTKG